MTLPASLWLVGCGNMGGALLRGWIAGGLPPASVTVIDPGMPEVPAGVVCMAAPPAGTTPDWLVLGIKPQQFGAVAAALSEAMPGRPRLLLSMLAGIEEAALLRALPADACVRIMPNLPVAIGKGVVALHSATAGQAMRDAVAALMAPLGLVEWVTEERLLHAVTALAGSGPGFIYRLLEGLAEAGAALGLPPDQSERFAVAMVEGAAALATQSDEPPAALVARVASPGGTTRAGLDVLDTGDALRQLIHATLVAAHDRSVALADTAR